MKHCAQGSTVTIRCLLHVPSFAVLVLCIHNSLTPYKAVDIVRHLSLHHIAARSGRLVFVAMTFPYTYISCPCIDVSVPANKDVENEADGEEQERTFDPTYSRTNYSLYTLAHLMYCEDCQQIRCPRCTIEEIVCWYCPGCLFEIPTSQLKSEGNR